MLPIYRWKSFWFGVPGLIFLLWVWWDSGGYKTSVGWNWGNQSHWVSAEAGQISWECTTVSPPPEKRPPGPPPPEGFHAGEVSRESSRRGSGRGFDFPEAFSGKSEADPIFAKIGITFDGMGVALWVIVGSYLVVWTGAVCWWWRRKARVMPDAAG